MNTQKFKDEASEEHLLYDDRPLFDAKASDHNLKIQDDNSRITGTTSQDLTQNYQKIDDQSHKSRAIFSPGSPGKRKFADIMMSPVRYTQRKFRAGGTSGSIFSLVAATLGAGTLTFPYCIKENGIAWGCILVVLGALISYYTGMLLVIVSTKTNTNRYEDYAQVLYGRRMSIFTSIMNLFCLMGFIMSYIVYIKKAIPKIISLFTDEDSFHSFIVDPVWGPRFWGTIYAFGILFPLSIPRSINQLRYSSAFGVLCSVYLCFAVIIIFWSSRTLVPDPLQNWRDADYFKFDFSGIVSSVPLIIFAYMYQVNIPMIYHELERRNLKQMSGVLAKGSGAAVILYSLVGIFGYLTFVNTPGFPTDNILDAPYQKNVAITVGNFALFFAVLTASPLCVLPTKDTVEELFWKESGMTKKVNVLVALGIIAVCYVPAIFIADIGDAITIAGCTFNPIVGFILPIIYYWKTIEDKKLLSKEKILAIIVGVVIIIVSVLGMYDFIRKKVQGE
eukprot:403373068